MRSKEAVRGFLDSVERAYDDVTVVRNADIGPRTDEAAIQHAPLPRGSPTDRPRRSVQRWNSATTGRANA